MLLHSIPFDSDKLTKLENAVNVFNTMLEGKKFAAVDHLTIADISLVVTVSNLEVCWIFLKQTQFILRFCNLLCFYRLSTLI